MSCVKMRCLRYILPVYLVMAGCATGTQAGAQTAPAGPLAPRAGAPPEAGPARQNSIRVEANEVVLPVIVRNKAGEMILSLRQENFHIFEDGVEQKIDHFGVGGEPLSIALLVENSARIAPLLPAIRKAGVVFAQPVLGQTAEAEVLSYDRSVRVLEKFSTDADSFENTIASLEPGDGGANLYDAIERAIAGLEERPQGQRRILLVIGEAQDTGSRASLGEVLRRAQIANVTIYSVRLGTAVRALRTAREDSGASLPPVAGGDPRQDEMNRRIESGADLTALAVWLLETGKNAIGPNALAVASQSTGGLSIHTEKDRSIERAIDTIGGELHAQYTVAYTARAEVAGGYHRVRVTVDQPGVTVRSRPGYYLADSR